MKKFFIGLVIGLIIAFPLGINFGKDVPLWSNPFTAKPDITERVKERTEDMLKDTKEAIHEATKPVKDKLQK
jgi:gas vesicle protein